MSVTAKRWVLKNAFVGYPKRDDFEIVEETLPALKDGGKRCMRMLDRELHHARRRATSHRLQALIFSFFLELEFLVEALWVTVDPYMR